MTIPVVCGLDQGRRRPSLVLEHQGLAAGLEFGAEVAHHQVSVGGARNLMGTSPEVSQSSPPRWTVRRFVKGAWNRPNRFFFRKLIERLRTPTSTNLAKLGSEAHGWVVPVDWIRRDWICYCAGVGTDITFDLALIERFGCLVYAFDPTPRSVAHVEAVAVGVSQFVFQPIGVWTTESHQKFFHSRNPTIVNNSVVNIHGTEDFFVAQCKPVKQIMGELGHARVDLLKLNVEGAEHDVLDNLIVDDALPSSVLCVEFVQPVPHRRTYISIRRVLRQGFELVAINKWKLTFLARQSVRDY
jgi:FkbM family methyltransferase